MKYVKNKKNICDCSIQHPYKGLLKVKGLTYYVNFVAEDVKPNGITKSNQKP